MSIVMATMMHTLMVTVLVMVLAFGTMRITVASITVTTGGL